MQFSFQMHSVPYPLPLKEEIFGLQYNTTFGTSLTTHITNKNIVKKRKLYYFFPKKFAKIMPEQL